jgi:hypothetical protein
VGKVGIALVPSVNMIEAIVELQQTIISICPLCPVLASHANLPHITLLQGRFSNSTSLIGVISALREYLTTQKNLLELQPGKIEYVPQGWYFLTLYPNELLIAAHNFVFERLGEQMFLTPSDRKKDISAYNDLEKSNYLRYGYRYIRDAFHPHITLGRTLDKLQFIEERQILKIEQDFLSKCRGIMANVTIYEVGENGSHAKTIHSVNI